MSLEILAVASLAVVGLACVAGYGSAQKPILNPPVTTSDISQVNVSYTDFTNTMVRVSALPQQLWNQVSVMGSLDPQYYNRRKANLKPSLLSST